MRSPQLSQINITLQSSIHQFGTARTNDRGLENCYDSCCYTYPVKVGYVGGIEVSPPQSGSIMATPVPGTRHGHVNYARSELRQLVQPRGRKSAGCRSIPVTPDGGADTRSIAELTVVDEIHPRAAPPPCACLHPALYGLQAESDAAGLVEGDDSVLLAKHVVQHNKWTLVSVVRFRHVAISVRWRSLTELWCLGTSLTLMSRDIADTHDAGLGSRVR